MKRSGHEFAVSRAMGNRFIIAAGVLTPLCLLLSQVMLSQVPPGATPWTLLAWSEFGMNPVERDYSVFAIRPLYATLRAQLIDASGKLVTNGSAIRVTYGAHADPSGSVNSTSSGKTNFWRFSNSLFGAANTPDSGIAGASMPSSAPLPMVFDPAFNRFSAEGIPITPYDDQWNLNYYPLMTVTARDASGNVLAAALVSLPVSNDVECRTCHASGASDFKRNILTLHDERHKTNPVYASSLAAAGYPSTGLLAAVAGGKPVLCTACHASNEFNKPGLPGVRPLTADIHASHASVVDSKTSATLDSSTTRTACYACHPGTATHALRGAMGRSVASDGKLQIECQNCHGNLTAVGNPARRGYLDMPNCQACHTTQLPRQTTAFDAAGKLRITSDTTFATIPGASLYRNSIGHGGLECPACHGATHAEYPSAQPNDNLQSNDLQTAPGAIKECAVCHRSAVTSSTGGPHGMHATGAAWVSSHGVAAITCQPCHPSTYHGQAPHDLPPVGAACQTCHGANLEGTVLSQAFVSRTLTDQFGTLNMYPGFRVSCYSCHNGPAGGGPHTAIAPTVGNTAASAVTGQSVTFQITVSSGATLRIVTQPRGGTAFVTGNAITYQANADFEGTDQVTYASTANSLDSNLGAATITVTAATRPQLAATPIANAASYAPGAVSPGMIAYIPGQGLGPTTLATFELNSGGFIEKSLQSTRVLFDGKPAPLLYASSGALGAIVPYAVAGQSQTSMLVEYAGIASAPVTTPVRNAVPGIFTSDGTGKGQAAAVNQDGALNTPSQPAAKGSVIQLFLTGDGLETPTPPDGKLATAPYAQAAQPVTVTIGGHPAEIAYAGAAPGAVAGLMQLNAIVPPDAATGTNEVIVTSGAASSSAATIQVK